ncbi:MAG: hypothetical protein ABJE47_23915, partial [bacterium]
MSHDRVVWCNKRGGVVHVRVGVCLVCVSLVHVPSLLVQVHVQLFPVPGTVCRPRGRVVQGA